MLHACAAQHERFLGLSESRCQLCSNSLGEMDVLQACAYVNVKVNVVDGRRLQAQKRQI